MSLYERVNGVIMLNRRLINFFMKKLKIIFILNRALSQHWTCIVLLVQCFYENTKK